MGVHVEPITFTVRGFTDGKGWGDEFEGVMTIQKMGNKGFCSGCHGSVNFRHFRELEALMEDYGITELIWEKASVSGTVG